MNDFWRRNQSMNMSISSFARSSLLQTTSRWHALRAGIVACGVVLGLFCAEPARAEVPGARAAIDAGDCKAAGDAINAGLARNDAEAFFYAGLLYDQSGCVDHDPARAARLYSRAIAAGYHDAGPYLGLLYGLGQGVAQDYAMAHRAFHADDAAAGDSASSPVEQTALGYGETLAQLALREVSYPTSANRNGIEGTVDVVLAPTSGRIDFDRVHIGIEVGSMIPRTHDFTDQIEAAYRSAMAKAPRPDFSSDASIRIDTPWHFGMRRSYDNHKVPLEGLVTLGESRILR